MTLYQIVSILKQIALTQPNVKSATDGSVYDVMNANPSVKYDVVHLSQTKHISDEETDTYGFNIFYISRLEDSLEDNRLQIQSIGKEVLDNILRTFCENFSIDFPEIMYYPFTQRFTDLCAGVYCRVEIEVPRELICADDYIGEVVPSKGIKLESIKVEIDENGTREVVPSPGFDGISKVTIVTNVPGTGDLEYQEVEYTENGEYTILPSSGYAGLSEVAVSVDVPSRYDEGYEDGKEDGIDEQKAKLTVTSFTQNDTYTREDGWSAVTVNVPSDYQEGYDDGFNDGEDAQKAKLSSTSFTQNSAYTNADGWSAVTVDVDDRYDEGYDDGVADQKAKLSSTAFTDNGTYTNPDGWSSVTVNSPWRSYFASAITLNVASAITDIGTATTTYSPATAYTDIYYTSSDPSIATIDPQTGVITAKTEGEVTICTIDRITNLQDCKQVTILRSSGLVMDVVYNVTSTTEPTQILSSRWGEWQHIVVGRLDDDTPIPIHYGDTTGYTFPTTGLVNVHYVVTGDTLNSDFSGVQPLVRLTIPEGITTLNGHLCDWDNQLTAVTIPSTLSGTMQCFMDCTSLTGITIPSGITVIGGMCFEGCESMSSVTIPSGVTEIKADAFGGGPGHNGLTAMTFEGTVPPILGVGNPAVYPALGPYDWPIPIYVPCEAIDAYKTAPVWQNYSHRIRCKGSGITALTLNVDSAITDYGLATTTCSPSTAYTDIYYTSSDPSIATVDELTGLITAIASGTVTISAIDRYTGLQDSETVEVDTTLNRTNPLTFNITGNGDIVWLANSTGFITTIEYKKNDGDWTGITASTAGTQINVASGDVVMFRGDNPTYNNQDNSGNTFEGSTAQFNVSGNIMSLVNSANYSAETQLESAYTFRNLFSGCTGLTSAENLVLPATTLSEGCYKEMFEYCINMVKAPTFLPATVVTKSAYMSMFSGCTLLTIAPNICGIKIQDAGCTSMFESCTSLTTAPELPATTLNYLCYAGMFQNCSGLVYSPSKIGSTYTIIASATCTNMFNGCTSLTTAPELPATTLANSCYYYMFQGCRSLTTAPELPATTLASQCYEYMFYHCSGLVNAPVLPATALANRCYTHMFEGCWSLLTPPALPALTMAGGCYESMFKDCTGLTAAPVLSSITLAERCYYEMFEQCSGLTTAPDLPAIILPQECYMEMFNKCTNLSSVKCLARDISATRCTSNWLLDVASTGTFVKEPNITWPTGANGIPSGWTIIDNS